MIDGRLLGTAGPAPPARSASAASGPIPNNLAGERLVKHSTRVAERCRIARSSGGEPLWLPPGRARGAEDHRDTGRHVRNVVLHRDQTTCLAPTKRRRCRLPAGLREQLGAVGGRPVSPVRSHHGGETCCASLPAAELDAEPNWPRPLRTRRGRGRQYSSPRVLLWATWPFRGLAVAPVRGATSIRVLTW